MTVISKELMDIINTVKADPHNKEKKIELLKMALKEAFVFSTNGFGVFPSDQKIMSRIATGLIYTQQNAEYLRDILIKKTDLELFEQFLVDMSDNFQEYYRKYFNCHVKELPDGRLYSELFDMYWNSETGMWERVSNGWHEFRLPV